MNAAATSLELSPEPVLKVERLSAGYGTIPVTVGIDLAVSAGEVVALLGANGAGKTTILRAIAGVLKPSEGCVRLHGREVREPLHKRSRNGLAYVPEERGVFRELTTMENLRLGRGKPEAALDLMPELRPLVNRRAGLLSGGEQQMLTIGRALAAEPAMLLCDELSLGLAPKIVDRLIGLLRRGAENGIAVLLVEQQARKALHGADRAYVISRGRVVLTDSSAALLGRLDEIEEHYLSGIASD